MRLCYDIEANGLVNYELDNKGNMKPMPIVSTASWFRMLTPSKVWKFRPGQHMRQPSCCPRLVW